MTILYLLIPITLVCRGAPCGLAPPSVGATTLGNARGFRTPVPLSGWKNFHLLLAL